MLGKVLGCFTRFHFIKDYLFCRKGATAIEFSLLAIPYLMLTLAIIELSIMYASASLLEGATNSAARLIRTGQIQQGSGDPETAFRDGICSYVTALIDCNAVQLEVVQLDSYANFSNYSATFDGNGDLASQGFDAGGSGHQVLVRVMYRYEMMTPFVGMLLVGPSNERLFISTIVLQTEPYEFNGGA